MTILIKSEGAAWRGPQMVVEFKHANRLDDQKPDDIERRAIRKWNELAFDGDARAEELEQVQLDRGRAPGRDIDLFSALVRRYRVQKESSCSQGI